MAKRKRTNPRRQPVTKADVEKIKKETQRDIFKMVICLPVMAAHDCFGFGPQRLEKLVDRMLELYNDWEAGDFSVEDAQEWLADYAGLRLEEAHE